MSKSSLQSRNARHHRRAIHSLFKQWDSTDTPGVAIAVSVDGEVIYRHAFGMANLGWSIPIDHNTVFDTGSVSKQFTAYAIHLLIDEGALCLDRPVGELLPELPRMCHRITVQQLLTHTGGIRDSITSFIVGGRFFEDRKTTTQVNHWLRRQTKLNHEPGSACSYSNTGYFVLAQLVERVTGEALPGFCASRIFEPLGLESTKFRGELGEIIQHAAEGYFLDDDGRYEVFTNNFAVPGPGSLQTTIDDLISWLGFLEHSLQQNHHIIEGMHRRGCLDNGTTLPYASGLIHGVEKEYEFVGHNGKMGPFQSLSLRIPKHKLALAMLSNSQELNPSGYWTKIADRILGKEGGNPISKFVPNDASSIDVMSTTTIEPARITGFYRDPGSAIFEVTYTDENFYVAPWRGEPRQLIRTGELSFRVQDLPNIMVFNANDNGDISHYHVEINDFIEPDRIKIAPGSALRNLCRYTGQYYSSELQTVYTVGVQDGSLTLSHLQFGAVPMEHIEGNIFGTTVGQWLPTLIQFELNHTSNIDRLSMSCEWSSGIEFLRLDLP